jgi:hypothetical protein
VCECVIVLFAPALGFLTYIKKKYFISMENIINTNEEHRFRLFDAKYHVNVGKFDVYLLSLKKVFFSQKGGCHKKYKCFCLFCLKHNK